MAKPKPNYRFDAPAHHTLEMDGKTYHGGEDLHIKEGVDTSFEPRLVALEDYNASQPPADAAAPTDPPTPEEAVDENESGAEEALRESGDDEPLRPASAAKGGGKS